MRVKDIKAEDFVNYKVPSMFIVTSFCDWKCCDGEPSLCQNYHSLSCLPIIDLSPERIYDLYIKNDISSAVVFGGLEPLLQFEELIEVIDYFRARQECCPIVIYTGYEQEEIEEKLLALTKYNNIILKLGHYIPNRKNRYDELLGVTLSSDNQYAIKVS